MVLELCCGFDPPRRNCFFSLFRQFLKTFCVEFLINMNLFERNINKDPPKNVFSSKKKHGECILEYHSAHMVEVVAVARVMRLLVLMLLRDERKVQK